MPGLGAISFLGSLTVRLDNNFEKTMIWGGLYSMLWFRLKRSSKRIVFLWFEKLKLYSRQWGGGGVYTATTIIPTIIPFRRNEFADSEYSKRKQVENVGYVKSLKELGGKARFLGFTFFLSFCCLGHGVQSYLHKPPAQLQKNNPFSSPTFIIALI